MIHRPFPCARSHGKKRHTLHRREKHKRKKEEGTANGGNGRQIEAGKQIVTIYGKTHKRERELGGKTRRWAQRTHHQLRQLTCHKVKQRRASRIEQATAARTPSPPPPKGKKLPRREKGKTDFSVAAERQRRRTYGVPHQGLEVKKYDQSFKVEWVVYGGRLSVSLLLPHPLLSMLHLTAMSVRCTPPPPLQPQPAIALASLALLALMSWASKCRR
ncbi:uncharacterized protein BDZ83DRAFT_328375 [Colletotrichum acutatum]|uniref:Uncharacterized protein n=1 Tax=Glomerella acutata TaxID=27357 RepID=A0AAD8XH51_GLOAC|nr:uncharacterized protein BDZ83DRAFT_328375 [Colletotrichum acutatum]KAK1724633.1 hypothetical protein BDZ83DRAFT_328375 [Colletotrichum acutatum]